jgi:formimidoylglutamase
MPTDDAQWPRADQWLASQASEPDLVVVGVPCSVASLSPSRSDLAPAALRSVLDRFSCYQSEVGADLGTLSVADRGDLDLSGLGMEDSQREIESSVTAMDPAPLTIFIGGDNAITRPLIRAMAPAYDLGVLTIDAHHDVRSLDFGPTNGTPIRGLLVDGLAGDRVAQVGIHSFANSGEYRRFCEDEGIAVFTMDTVEDWGVEETVSVAFDHLLQHCDRVYLDVDLDVLDVAYAPGCPGARPGGMTPRQLARAVRVAGRRPEVFAADFVEVDPSRDPAGVTVMNLANAFLSFCAGITQRPPAR